MNDRWALGWARGAVRWSKYLVDINLSIEKTEEAAGRTTTNWVRMMYLLGFPATLFLSTVLRALRGSCTGGKFTHQATCYVSKHTVVYNEGE